MRPTKVTPVVDIHVTSWKRPDFLRTTLDSIFRHTRPMDRVFVVDNGSGPDVTDLIRGDKRLAGFTLWDTNRGINAALEDTFTKLTGDYVLTSDADLVYRCPFQFGVDWLESHPEDDCFSFQDAPEHPAFERDGAVKIKRVERGGALLLRRSVFERLRPFPVHQLIDWDWWVFRDAHRKAVRCACIDSVVHLGWRNRHVGGVTREWWGP